VAEQTPQGWATNIQTGPSDEASQAVTFLVTTNNDMLFVVPPELDTDGTLTYTPDFLADGVATVTVHLQDDGGTGNGGVDTSLPVSFTITVTPAQGLGFAIQSAGADHPISNERGRAAGLDVSIFPDGSSIVTGYFSGRVTFGVGEGNETSLTAVGGSDVFVARYESNGTLAWARQAGGTNSERGQGVVTLSDGSIAVAGFFVNTATFGAGQPAETTLTATDTDIFVARYTADGLLIWARQAGGVGNDAGVGIAVLPDDGIVLTGRFEESATFGLSETNETTLMASGTNDIFVARYDPNGQLVWARQVGGSGPARRQHCGDRPLF
jgi:hypothetical protein